MPFDPRTTDQRSQIILQTGQQLSSGLQRMLADITEQRRQQEYNDGILGVINGAGSQNGFPDSPAARAILQGAVGKSPASQSGALAGFQLLTHLREEQDRVQSAKDQLGFEPTQSDFDRAHAAGYELVPTGHGRYRAVSSGGTSPNRPAFTPSPEQIAEGAKVGLKWLPTSNGQGQWVHNTPGKAPPADSLELLDKDVRAISGAPLANFINGKNHRMVGDQFMVDAPGIGAGTVQMPEPMYQRFRTRYNAITGVADSGGTVGVQTPGVGPAASDPAAQPSGVDPTAALTQARAKIQAGADPSAVKTRLQQLGVDPSGL